MKHAEQESLPLTFHYQGDNLTLILQCLIGNWAKEWLFNFAVFSLPHNCHIWIRIEFICHLYQLIIHRIKALQESHVQSENIDEQNFHNVLIFNPLFLHLVDFPKIFLTWSQAHTRTNTRTHTQTQVHTHTHTHTLTHKHTCQHPSEITHCIFTM